MISERLRERARGWLRARDLELIASFLVVALLVFMFLQVADRVGQGPVSIDDRILLALRSPDDIAQPRGGEAMKGILRDLTALGSGTITGLFTVGLIGYLLLTRRPAAALFVTVAVLGCWLLNDLLKELFARDRPTIVPHLMPAHEPSFPSGHTMISATLYPTLAELFGRLITEVRARLYLMLIAILLALLVGLSRVYLGVHYPSDVVAGLCLGFGWALACGIAARLLQKHRILASRSRPGPAAA